MNKLSLARRLCVAALFCAAGGAFAQTPPIFSSITAVGPLTGGTTSLGTGVNLNTSDAAYGVNAAGGSTTVTTGGKNAFHAFLYSGSSPPKDLGTLAGPTGLLSAANGINASGRAVGYSYTTTLVVAPIHAFSYNAGSMSDLGTLAGPKGLLSVANAVNASGIIVGSSYTTANLIAPTHAFLYNSASSTPIMADLGTLDSSTPNNFSVAYAINATGQVVGNSMKGGALHGFFVGNTNGSTFAMTDLGVVGGVPLPPPVPAATGAFGINSGGQVVGSMVVGSGATAAIHAFSIPSTGTVSGGDIGTLSGYTNSQAIAINDGGLVVGTLYSVGRNAPASHAFLYQNGRMYDLNTLLPQGTPTGSTGWVLNTATAIDSNGDISGTGTLNGQTRAFLLVPLQVTGITPNSGPTSSGTSITITGTGFTGATAVTFGTVPATSFTVVSSTQISATAPAQSAAGVVNVSVATPGGTSSHTANSTYTYTAAASIPIITSVTPDMFSEAASTQITIMGSGFLGATQVNFYTYPSSFVVANDTTIYAQTPNVAGACGGYGTIIPIHNPNQNGITVVTPAGQSNAFNFTFTCP